eukprot:CAMPEP_0183422278 /NCGR_PEP_ID=MMETSP0370-20130417/27701_1 /TAXON_ID=268820 /ORGANISM="Peridinium aciculiferum, Strain PAER-2" /LENGTH=223 /DNA_ID=CAMNT_0025606355 /DNA_START=141 /DNA_END=810 /DNA_ORIENTATION=-
MSTVGIVQPHILGPPSLLRLRRLGALGRSLGVVRLDIVDADLQRNAAADAVASEQRPRARADVVVHPKVHHTEDLLALAQERAAHVVPDHAQLELRGHRGVDLQRRRPAGHLAIGHMAADAGPCPHLRPPVAQRLVVSLQLPRARALAGHRPRALGLDLHEEHGCVSCEPPHQRGGLEATLDDHLVHGYLHMAPFAAHGHAPCRAAIHDREPNEAALRGLRAE